MFSTNVSRQTALCWLAPGCALALLACSSEGTSPGQGAMAAGGGAATAAGTSAQAGKGPSAGSAGRAGNPAANGGKSGGTATTAAGQSGARAGSSGSTGTAGSESGVAGTPGAAGMSAPAPGAGDGFYRMERLNRGVVAVTGTGGVYVGWRMFGTEYAANAPDAISYDVYRDGMKIANVTNSTNYQDASGTANAQYAVRAVVSGAEQEMSETVTPWAQNYLRVPLQPPAADYSANDASAADLDGDGDYEIVLKWDPNNAKDNSQAGVTGNVFLDGLQLDGKRLWRIDLGPNIRAGAHYTQFIVFDFDGDGKAEIAVKTAPGTKAGNGTLLAMGPAANDDDKAVYRNSDGYVLTGPEYLTVFNGDTGAELTTVNFDVPRGTVSAWGDDYGNRVDRFLAAAAYLDDTGLPSFVMARGYYTRTTLTAWNWRDGKLSQLWKFDSNTTPKDAAGHPYSGQGSHNLSVANIDADKGQEIIYGAMAIDNDGKGKCSTGNNHGDALHVSDFVLSNPGLEVFMPNEDGAHPAYYVRDANSCKVLFAGPVNGNDTGRAVAADILPGNPGAEIWASGSNGLLDAASGKMVGNMPASTNFVIWWDADESRELEDAATISKYGGGTLVSCSQCTSNNGTKSTPTLSGDLIGDWREEIIWRESDNSALRLYTTTAVTTRRIYTLMHDPQYRAAIAWQNVAYNQPPHPSFAIGQGMADPPKPDIRTR